MNKLKFNKNLTIIKSYPYKIKMILNRKIIS